MKIKHNFIHLIFPAVILLTLLVGYAATHFQKITYTPMSSSETTAVLSNPYMGWYSLIGYTLSDSELPTVPSSYSAATPPTELVLLEINLCQYANSDISDIALSNFDTLLSAWSDTPAQLILRFVYDWDGNNLAAEPSSIDQIRQHICQVAPIINKYKASVYLLQGIFVGNWGEMNHSRYLLAEDITSLIQKLADLTDPSIFLAVRTPAQLRTILKTAAPLSSSSTYDGSLSARLGLYNDGMLASDTDAGTYGTSSSDTSDYTKSWARADELVYQNRLCNYVPNGGEVILPNAHNDLDAAISDLQTMHVSYLNKDYDPDVIDEKWKNSSYSGSDTLYQGLSGFDYISSHLGYRYVLTDSSLSDNQLSVTIENKGFASCYRPLDVTLTITSQDDHNQKVLTADTDTRNWLSGKSSTFRIPFDLSELAPGSYTLSLKLTDPSQSREILLACDLSHNTSGYVTGTLQVHTFLSEFTK